MGGSSSEQNESLSPIAYPLPTAKANLVSASIKTRPSISNWAARDHVLSLLVLKKASEKEQFSILEFHFYLLILFICFLLYFAVAFAVSSPKGCGLCYLCYFCSKRPLTPVQRGKKPRDLYAWRSWSFQNPILKHQLPGDSVRHGRLSQNHLQLRRIARRLRMRNRTLIPPKWRWRCAPWKSA